MASHAGAGQSEAETRSGSEPALPWHQIATVGTGSAELPVQGDALRQMPTSIVARPALHLAPSPAVIGASGLGEEPAAGETPAVPRGAGTPPTHSTGRFVQKVSMWRLPPAPGKMPIYVQRSFRLKALGLLCAQLFVVLAIMVASTLVRIDGVMSNAVPGVLLAAIVLVILALIILSGLKAFYPLNYILLGLVTVLAGLAWGIAGELLPAHVHFQIIGIICIAMVCVTCLATALSFSALEPWPLVLMSIFSGWLVGVVTDAWLAQLLGIGDWKHTWIAIAVTFVLFLIFTWEAGRLLVDCNPDTFMNVVVAMDSSLLVVVSIPVFWLMGFTFVVTCCLRSAVQDGEPPEEGEGEQDIA